MMNAYPRWSFLAALLLAVLGCSDPVPPPAQGAVTLDVGLPVTHVDGKTCPVSHLYNVGALDKNKMTLSPSIASPGQALISGDNGSTISCSVTGSPGNFTFSGSIHAATSEGDLISVSFANGVVGADFTGTADVAVYTPQLSQNFSSPQGTPCTIAIQPAPGTGSNVPPQIKGGSIWGTFTCPQIASPPSGLCGVEQPASAFLFENCAGS